MEHITIKLPGKISRFISRHFPDHSLICTKHGEDEKKDSYYSIDLVKDNVYHHLKISVTGNLISSDQEPVFEEGYCEQYY